MGTLMNQPFFSLFPVGVSLLLLFPPELMINYSWLVGGGGEERRVSASFDKLHCSLLLLSRGC